MEEAIRNVEAVATPEEIAKINYNLGALDGECRRARPNPFGEFRGKSLKEAIHVLSCDPSLREAIQEDRDLLVDLMLILDMPKIQAQEFVLRHDVRPSMFLDYLKGLTKGKEFKYSAKSPTGYNDATTPWRFFPSALTNSPGNEFVVQGFPAARENDPVKGFYFRVNAKETDFGTKTSVTYDSNTAVILWPKNHQGFSFDDIHYRWEIFNQGLSSLRFHIENFFRGVKFVTIELSQVKNTNNYKDLDHNAETNVEIGVARDLWNFYGGGFVDPTFDTVVDFLAKFQPKKMITNDLMFQERRLTISIDDEDNVPLKLFIMDLTMIHVSANPKKR